MKLFYLTFFGLSALFYSIGNTQDDIDFDVPRSKLRDLCNSPVYCQGNLLHTIQIARVYRDSKKFVDLCQKYDEHITVANFNELMNKTNNNPSENDIREFVKNHFLEVDELEEAELSDWNENPKIVDEVQDPHYQTWLKELNNLWKTLARRIKTDVQQNPTRYSIIYVNNSFIIPGGRFKEFYYWDTYWIIKGLLITGLRETAKGIIQNFLSMVDNYGFIPNGGRVYYLMRSQPPLLSQSVYEYYKMTKDVEFVLSALPRLEKEFNYWHENKTVRVRKGSNEFLMARYVVASSGPRPESYREDYESAQSFSSEESQQRYYENVKAAAESGWDFSARWFDDDGEFTVDISKMSTSDILPVDLNAFVERNARILSKFFSMQDDVHKSRYYKKLSNQYKAAIHHILWNETDGTWYDFNMRSKKQNTRFYMSNLTPLYTKSYNLLLSAKYGERTVEYLHRIRAIKAGGIPTSLDWTGQQWDFPNAWAPLMSIAVQGLRNTDYGAAEHLSKHIATLWLQSNYDGFVLNNGTMYEKYNVLQVGSSGKGGEYEPQTGFGWSNGVVLEFLQMYPDIRYNKQIGKTNEVEGRQPRIWIEMPKPSLRSVWDIYFE